MKKLIVLLICLLAGAAQATEDTLGTTDTLGTSPTWGALVEARIGSKFTAAYTGTLDSVGALIHLGNNTELKYACLRAVDSSIVDTSILDTLPIDTGVIFLPFVGGATIKADSEYFLIVHTEAAEYARTVTSPTSQRIFQAAVGLPSAVSWETGLTGWTRYTSATVRIKAWYTVGGEPPAVDTVTSRYRNGNLRSGKYR